MALQLNGAVRPGDEEVYGRGSPKKIIPEKKKCSQPREMSLSDDICADNTASAGVCGDVHPKRAERFPRTTDRFLKNSISTFLPTFTGTIFCEPEERPTAPLHSTSHSVGSSSSGPFERGDLLLPVC